MARSVAGSSSGMSPGETKKRCAHATALEAELAEREAEAEGDFSGDDWQKQLEYDPRTMTLKNTLHNLKLIIANDEGLQAIVFNQLADGMEIRGAVPWQHPSKFWRDQDDAQLISYVDTPEDAWRCIREFYQLNCDDEGVRSVLHDAGCGALDEDGKQPG